MTKFEVQPQRSNGVAFVPCEVHKATSWAVVRIDNFTRKGRKFTASRVVARCSTRTEARGLAEMQTKRFAPTPRHLVRKLGLRIVSEK